MSKYFKNSEFACKCGCGFSNPHPALVDMLDIIREYVGKPIIVNSGCRCGPHNAKVGGAQNSQHLKGMAADIRCKDKTVPAGTLWQRIRELMGMGKLPMLGGLGRYDTFVHLDVREGGLRQWDYRKHKHK